MKNIFNRLAAAWRNRKADGIKVGDTVEIIDDNFHFLTLRSKAKVLQVFPDHRRYKLFGELNFSRAPWLGLTHPIDCEQFLQRDQFRKVETTKKPLNKLAVFASAVLFVLFVTALIIAFMPSNSAADMGKVIACAAGLIGLGAVAYIFIYDPSTDHFCDAIDNANSLTENEDEWLGM